MSEVLTHKLPLKHELARHIADVLISSPSDGQVLTYEAATALWKNKAAPGAGLSYQTAEGTTDAETTSQTYVDIPGLSITVTSAGTYMILWEMINVRQTYTGLTTYGLGRLLRNSTVVKEIRLTYYYYIFTKYDVLFHTFRSLSASEVLKCQWRNTDPESQLFSDCATEQATRRLSILKLS